MAKFTDLEVKVIKAIRDICIDEVDARPGDIAGTLGVPVNTIKGALGSLQKKDCELIALGQGEEPNARHTAPLYDCVNYVDRNGEIVSFGCDRDPDDFHTDEEIDQLAE